MYESRYVGRKYILSLTNGTNLNFELPIHSLPHLLGLNSKAITNDAIVVGESAVQQMKELIRKPNYYYQLYEQQGKSVFDFISPYYEEKLQSFRLLKEISPYEIAFFSEYDRRKGFFYNAKNKMDLDYLMGFCDNMNYACLGLRFNSYTASYTPITNLYLSRESLTKLLFGQTFYPIFYTSTEQNGKKESICMQAPHRIGAINEQEQLALESNGCLNMTRYLMDQIYYSVNLSNEKEKIMEHLNEQNKDLEQIATMDAITIEDQTKKIQCLEEQLRELRGIKEQLDPVVNDFDLDILKQALFGEQGVAVNTDYLIQSLHGLLNEEYQLLCATYGKKPLPKKTILEQFQLTGQKYKTALYHIVGLVHEIYSGLELQNPFYQLFTNPEQMEQMIYQLPEEEQMIFLLRYGFLDGKRYNTNAIVKETGYHALKIKKIEEQGKEKIMQLVSFH